MEERLVTGKLLKPRGLKGDIGLEPFANDSERYLRLKKCYLESYSGEILEELEVSNVKLENQKVFLQFVGYEKREDVAKLSNHYLSVNRSEADTLEDNMYYVADIINCEVFSDEHGHLGKITDVYSNGMQPFVKISKQREADLYVPFINHTKQQVDIKNKKITLNLPDGLYEVYRTKDEI